MPIQARVITIAMHNAIPHQHRVALRQAQQKLFGKEVFLIGQSIVQKKVIR